jgi:outer membrane receptor protein involved in Fe transport
MQTNPSSRRGILAVSAFLLVSLPVAAQVAPTAPAKSNVKPADDTIVELSPFQVVSDNKGYQASNTLSGTRLNSKLEDLGASITVVTKEQMQDLASLDINDVFRYEASTEGTDNYTAFNRNRSGGVNDQIQSDPQRANRVRGVTQAGQSVGGANTAFGNFTSNSNIPFDPYNIAAIEISRGPNSNLFGLGQAAGTVSVVPTQANPDRRSYTADLRFDSFGGHRESLNINTPLLPGKLALRVAGVNESKGFTRKPSSERIHREFATFLYRPFKNTTLRVTGERYHDDYRRPNSITARDTSAEWLAAGSPTWDPTTQIVTYANGTKTAPITSDTLPAVTIVPGVTAAYSAFPAGLIGGYNGFYAHPTVYVDNNQIQLFTVTKTNNAVTGTTLATNPYTGGNSTLRYIQSGTDIMKRAVSLLGPRVCRCISCPEPTTNPSTTGKNTTWWRRTTARISPRRSARSSSRFSSAARINCWRPAWAPSNRSSAAGRTDSSITSKP